MKPDILFPSVHCLLATDDKQLLPTQEMHYWETFSLTLSLTLYSFIPPWSSFYQSARPRCIPLPKAWVECSHPLCKSIITTSPTHTFITTATTTITFSSSLFLSPFTLQCFSLALFLILHSVLLLHFSHFFLQFLPPLLPVACALPISIAIHLQAFLAPLPLTPFIAELPLPSSSCRLSVSHTHTHKNSSTNQN